MKKISLEEVKCDFCNGSVFDKKLQGIDWEFGRKEKFTLQECQECGLVQLNPRPKLSDIPLIYPSNYGYYNIHRYSIKNIASSILNTINNKIIARQADYPYLNNIKLGRILDVGCATGCSVYPYGNSGSLLNLKEKGWEVSGREIDSKAAEIGNQLGLNISVGNISDTEFKRNNFDVIRFNHALEHSTSPLKDLTSAYELLKNNGKLIITLPNIQSAAFVLFGHYWSGLDLPRHFYHFTPKNLKQYFDKVGFKVVEEHFDSNQYDFIHSLKHFLQSNLFGKENENCAENDILQDVYKSRFQIKVLSYILKPITNFFNKKGLGDSYTIIGTK